MSRFESLCDLVHLHHMLTRGRESQSPGYQNTPNQADQIRITVPKVNLLLDSLDSTLNKSASTAWTQGFFPGLLWLLVERNRLLPGSIEALYSEDEIIQYARKYQDSFKFLARPSINHDQGFRFQLSYGK